MARHHYICNAYTTRCCAPQNTQEVFNFGKYKGSGIGDAWKQMSWSRSVKPGILRGIHTSTYGKLVTCVRGAVYDVMVDLREDSPTFLRWCGVMLTEENRKQARQTPPSHT